MSMKRAGDDLVDGFSSKKLKSVASATSSAANLTGDALIAQKRVEIAAKLASMKKPSSSSAHASSAHPQTGRFSSEQAADLQRRIEEATKKVNAAKMKNNPYLTGIPVDSTISGSATPQGNGLRMTAHPLLLETTPAAPQSKKDKYKPMQPKFATLKANLRNAPTPPPAPATPQETSANPYSAALSKGIDGPAPKDRVGRGFRFNQKGKYIALGNQMRQDMQLEALKQRIAESAKKAGLDSEFETVEKNLRRAPPPAAEWWDVSLLPSKAYDDFSLVNAYIRTADSPISVYIQHPIPIPAPGSKSEMQLNPLKLTTKEQKKMRKQRRQAELQDKRDHIRMGLLPPDPPKVRLGNLMRVLTSDAVQDPTRVEARVRREVALRKHTHEKMNASRKLSPESRRAKMEEKKVAEESKGLQGAAFRIRTLSDPAHRYKVRKNAEQMNLTGICISNPNFNLVYVEGAAKFIRNYTRLMLQRIAWTEAARPRGGEQLEDQDDDSENRNSQDKHELTANEPDTMSLEDNRCDLIWEGEVLERAFLAFRVKNCPTDAMARDVLGPKLCSRWDAAKNWKLQDDEII